MRCDTPDTWKWQLSCGHRASSWCRSLNRSDTMSATSSLTAAMPNRTLMSSLSCSICSRSSAACPMMTAAAGTAPPHGPPPLMKNCGWQHPRDRPSHERGRRPAAPPTRSTSPTRRAASVAAAVGSRPSATAKPFADEENATEAAMGATAPPSAPARSGSPRRHLPASVVAASGVPQCGATVRVGVNGATSSSSNRGTPPAAASRTDHPAP